MNKPDHNLDWEQRLRNGLGAAPEPDFDNWCERHPDASASLASVAPAEREDAGQRNSTRRTVVASVKWLVAASLLIGGLIWFSLGGQSFNPRAFADDIPGVDGVRTMTWTTTSFVRWTSEDGQRTWIQKQRVLHAYRSPGQYRDTLLDQEGEAVSINITDYRAGRTLAIYPKEKKAALKFPIDQRDPRGPFARVGDAFRERNFGNHNHVISISLQGQREVDHLQANVVRVLTRSVGSSDNLRVDFMFDVASKQLVGMFATQPLQKFDLDSAEFANPPEEKWSRRENAGALDHEMVINPKIDADEFSLDPPPGYEFEKIAKPTVTEEEMISYLRAAVRFNAGQFPDSPFDAFDRDKLNAAWAKDETARTEIEQALIDQVNKIRLREIYQPPLKRFQDDQTTPKTFQYVGSGVKIGQSDRIVLWYKLRSSTRYRALYGDLSIKDVTETDLPLQLPR